MVSFNPGRARDAVQILVDSSYASHHIRRLRSAVLKPRTMPFKAELEALNELLRIGRQNLVAMENLIAIAEYKRDSRTDYQREHMRTKRLRDRKIVRLETLMRGRPLTVDEATSAVRQQYDIWRRERETAIADKLEWAERNAAIQAFWHRKETELDELLDEAQNTVDRVVHRKQVVRVEPKPRGALGEKLAAAMKRDKPKRSVVDKTR